MGWVEGEWREGVQCEDAPCCGCCGPQGDGSDTDSGMSKDDYMELYARDDFDFDMVEDY